MTKSILLIVIAGLVAIGFILVLVTDTREHQNALARLDEISSSFSADTTQEECRAEMVRELNSQLLANLIRYTAGPDQSKIDPFDPPRQKDLRQEYQENMTDIGTQAGFLRHMCSKFPPASADTLP